MYTMCTHVAKVLHTKLFCFPALLISNCHSDSEESHILSDNSNDTSDDNDELDESYRLLLDDLKRYLLS